MGILEFPQGTLYFSSSHLFQFEFVLSKPNLVNARHTKRYMTAVSLDGYTKCTAV